MTTATANPDSDALDLKQLLQTLLEVKKGNFSVRISSEQTGIAGKIADTLNDIIETNEQMTTELARISTVVGKEGKIYERVSNNGAKGSWQACVNSVNTLITDLVQPMAETTRVIRAVANGDLSQAIATDIAGNPLQGEFLQTAQIVNKMVGQLNSFASEVTRVARDVGTEGKLGVQADVRGVAGTWKDLTDSVNSMAGNLTAQVRNIAEVTTAVANGDLSKKITVDVKGEILELKNTINTMVDQLNSFASEVTRVAREVGTEGKLGVQAYVRGVGGTWKDLTDNVNLMAGNLTAQVRNIAEVATAIANGNLSKKITVDVKGEILDLKNTINTMVDQLSSFASEVTRVAREVGTEGKLGGQAQVTGVAGTWKDLTDNVNSMASNLTAQVRGIARVVTSVANGDLKRKLMLDAKGEIETLAETINEMIDTLATFAAQVTTVAREVGIEGKLGGQAKVPGASGTWRDLTDNVNELAANLTTQVRAIAEVATAVTKGDLTRSIAVEALGEVAALKDNINQMIANLRETTQKNTEQDWLKTNLAKFTRMLQGQRDLETVSKLILSELAPLVSAQHGVFYLMESGENHLPYLKLISSYAYRERKHLANRFYLGEGLVGQCALEKERILITEVPSNYIKISSGLGEAAPMNAVVLPVLFEGQVTAVIELASFNYFNEIHLTFFDQLTESIAIVLNTIAASMRTEELLKQSQSLAEELQSQQKELTGTNQRLEQQAKSLTASEELLKKQQEQLQQTNAELQEKAELLALQNREVERKNQEIEQARRSLEEKATQLALSSKYKSEFLANMSHELRTPLNSLLILARLLADNQDRNLTDKQVEYARTIHSSGNDLLALINDILDLAKIESGKMSVDIEPVRFTHLRENIERTFRQVAGDRQLKFEIQFDEQLPRTLYTDAKRLQQVLKNLLSNAFKFTDAGSVRLNVTPALAGWSAEQEVLNRAAREAPPGEVGVIAFSVTDTGIGIAPDKQQIIFEAFQQADGTTSRRYGGTGLGLSISREITRLLGGEIQLRSELGRGSTFTLYLPQMVSRTVEQHATPSLAPTPPLPTLPASPPEVVSLVESQISNLLDERAVEDDREVIQPGDRTLLIIEDDLKFVKILMDAARQQGFKVLVATRGNVGLALAQQFQPTAITLDIRLPIVDGWTVLDRLKHNPDTRHIPVHIISVEETTQRGLKQGAIAYLQKPISNTALLDTLSQIQEFANRSVKNLLIVERDELQRRTMLDLIEESDIAIQVVETGAAALEALQTGHFDCLVLNLALPDTNGFELIDRLKQEPLFRNLPIIVYTPRQLTAEEEIELQRLSGSSILKEARSPERLLEETTLFLHQTQADLPAPKRLMLEQLQQNDSVLAGKKVLVVDDDMRNIFALTSILERQQMQVIYAENGREGILQIQNNPDIDIVLMDIMMPEMDGYDTIRAIRQIDRLAALPIVALTAKAMQGDREKCLEVGASDYISKPIDTEQLFSLLRVWLQR
ncbi:GAF sensor hybrid histidine kinase [Chroococcidiopsis thermalis PCC 7203]|uniref:Circadian input-output histidine kinase CikA n=2 Tax=Chroococcidiopsis TaxID=54298 RepID=K9U5E4_CHRTP|nr:response regulator [Chroococcidiopsis thermalis]AFY90302.1 GAF sensor hybrid histidine kinase [Chroococcidiopsis thermalis PCC 7203]